MNERAQVPVEVLLLVVGVVIFATVAALVIKSTANTAVDNTPSP
jgi:uncharacterized protein (UPF0333 family)